MTTNRLKSTIEEIIFPTNANGLVSCLVKVELTPELEAVECGGVGFGIGTYIQEDNTLPFIIGDTVVMDFNEKGELSHHVIGIRKRGFTKLPRTCVSCGQQLRQIKDKNIVEGLLCTNLMSCTAQSASPIYRLSVIATDAGAFHEDFRAFIYEYPEAPLTHLSDLKIFLKSDPNTAPREAIWNNLKSWRIEKKIWEYLNQPTMLTRDFWIIGFNLASNFNPRDVLQDSTNTMYPSVILNNIDRVSQLIAFFDYWTKKEYVAEN